MRKQPASLLKIWQRMKNEEYHEPVLVQEVLDSFAPLKNARIIDATLGTGGHSLALIEKGAQVLGIEADVSMLEVARGRLKEACPTPNQNGWGSFKLVYANFKDLDKVAFQAEFKQVEGILFDLGVSNIQLSDPSRGFSFSNPEAALDMRIDVNSQGVRASDLLNGLRQDQLLALFRSTLDSGSSRWLVKRVVNERALHPLETVSDFLKICRGIRTKSTLHPATLPFLALRMAVNSERENLTEALPKAFDLLKRGGKLIIITFHSGEEKVVLDFCHARARVHEGNIINQMPITASQEEVRKNPKARSAEMWILKKI